MANNYTEIMKIVNQGNKMGLSNTITRDNGIPLDLSSVQETYEAAVIYAATKAIAYVGQPVAVGDKLYIISDTAAETKFRASDEKEYDNYLVEVGSKTEGDGVTIDLEAGVLRLHGFEEALAGYIPQKKAVYKEGSDTEIDHYEIEWVAISAIVEGDGNKVTTLTSEDGSVTITKKTDTDESLVYDLKIEHPVVPEYTVVVDEREEDATATTYHLTKDQTNEGVAIVVPDAYNDSALAGRVKTIEDAVNHETTGLAAHETRLAEVEKFFAATDPDKIDEALDTLIEIQKEIEADNASAEGMLASIGANTTAIEKLNGDAQTVGSVAKAVADAEERVAETYATKQDLTDHSNTMDGKLAGYYTKTETDGLLDAKVDDSQLENYYTKTETVAKTEVYTKGQIDQMLEDIEGGSTESAASVKRALDGYIQDTDTELYGADVVAGWTSEDGTYSPNYLNVTSRIDTAITNAATAQAQADKGVADAKTANDAITALTTGDGAVATNTSDITAIKGRLTTLEAAKGNHESRIAVAEGKLATHEEEYTNLNKTVGEMGGQITALQGEDGRLAGLINANVEEIAKKANSADVYTKGEVDTKVQEAIDAIPEVDFAPYLKSEDAAKTYATITSVETIYKAGEGEAEATGLLAEEIARAKAAEKANADSIALLTENPTEALDSVKELISHVQAQGTEVAGIITRLDGHDDLLAGIGGEDQPATVIDAIANAVNNLEPLAIATVDKLGGIKSAADVVNGETTTVTVNAVYVDSNTGIGSVKAVSTDALINGAEELILIGGSATA